MGGPSVRLSPPMFHMISAAGRDWAVQFASVTPGDDVTWLTSGLGKTGERKIVLNCILIFSSVNWAYIVFFSVILATVYFHRQQKADICSSAFIMEMERQSTSPVNIVPPRRHNDTSCPPTGQKTEAKLLLLTLCLCVWISVGWDKACLAERGEGHTHTEALCLGKQWATHPLGSLPN